MNPNRNLIKEKIEHADYILVTHAHYDHLMDVPEIVKNVGGKVYGSANTCQLLKILDVKEDQIQLIRVGAEFSLDNIAIKVIAAKHPYLPFFNPGPLHLAPISTLRVRDYRMDECFSFLIRYEDLRILVWSSISTEHTVPADVLFMRAVADKSWYREMMHEIHPQLVIPTHWDDMFRNIEKPIRPFWALPELHFPPLHRIDLDRFQQVIHQIDPRCKVLIPAIFHPYDLVSEIGQVVEG